MSKYLLIFFSCFILTGCSWLTTFYIYNYSNKTIKIKYTFDRSPVNDLQESFKKGQVFKIIEEDNLDLQDTLKVFSLDSANNTLTVELLPSQASYFGSVTYDFNSREPRQRQLLVDNIKTISIVKGADTIIIKKSIIPSCFSKTEQKYMYGLFIF